jgi:hypothetical protein
MLGSLEGMLGGAGKDQLMKSGSSILGSLLGQGGVDSLLGGLTKNTGIGSAAAASLLPLVGQMALGGIAKSASGMDATGLANMLTSQKNSFTTPAPAVETPRATAPSAPAPAAAGGGLLRWIIPLAAVLAALWYFMSGSQQPATTTTTTEQKPAETTAPAAATAVVIDGIDVGSTLTKTMTDLTGTLGGITDAATATAAVPKLQDAQKAVDGLAAVAGKMSAEQKTMVGGLITAAMPALRAAADKALAAAGVGDIAKPIVDGILTKIEALAK